MKKALVTGGTGFIGANLIRFLLKQGVQVRTLVRPTSCRKNLEGCDVEIVSGDLRDRDSLIKACQDCDTLFHVAAFYQLWAPDPQEFYDVNVAGTQNILEAASQMGISKVVYTSTVGVLRYPNTPEHPSDENAYPTDEDLHNHYKCSKFQAEQVAMRFARNGLSLVIVNPSAPIGSLDVKPTPTGKIVVDFLNGRVPAYIQTGLNIVDVEDVAVGHYLAALKGRTGERYILGNKNMSLQEIYQLMASIAKRNAPILRVPYGLALTLAYGSEGIADIFKRKPRIPVSAVKMAKKFMYFSSDKAVRELGLPQSPVERAFEKAIRWFEQNGYAK